MTRNNKSRGENVQDKEGAVVAVVAVAVVAVAMAVVAFLSPNAKWSENFILLLLALGVGVPLSLCILSYTSSGEVNLPGFGRVKWSRLEEGIGTVKQRQLANQAVVIADSSGLKWFWIDERGEAHSLPDLDTALFLSNGKGVIRVQADELNIATDEYPPFIEDAIPMKHGRDIFISYNNEIYYQRSLASLYTLAAKRDIFDKGKTENEEGEPLEIEKWEMPVGKPWMRPLDIDHIKKQGVKR